MSKIFLADLDGSLADFDGQMLEDYLSICSNEEKKELLDNYHRVSLRDLENQFQYIKNRTRLIKFQSGWWEKLKPIKQGISIYHLAQELGYKCYVLTQGPCKIPNAWSEKLKWCHANIGYNTQVNIVSDKGLSVGDILYDDYPDYCLSWLKTNPDGTVIMPVTRDNRDFTHKSVLKVDKFDRNIMKQILTEILNKDGQRICTSI